MVGIKGDPWALDDGGGGSDPNRLSKILEELSGKFKPSLVKRASKRLNDVKVVGDSSSEWTVNGKPSFSDEEPYYYVTMKDGKYDCTCYHNMYGDVRSHRFCSHVLAVMIYRRLYRSPNPTNKRRVEAGGTLEGEKEAVKARALDAPTPPLPLPTVPDVAVTPPVDAVPVLLDIPSPRDEKVWGVGGLPEWVSEIRPHQWQALEEIVEAYKNGAKVVWLDAPTGSGKTLIAEMVRRRMMERTAYVATTKGLQDQFMRDFRYAKLLKGRTNYPTLNKPFPEYTSGDCTKEAGPDGEYWCDWCDPISQCPYEVAKGEAIAAPLTVLNTAYFMTECNYIGYMRGRGLVVLDECDELEKQLMGFVEFVVSNRMMHLLNIEPPSKGSHKPTLVGWMGETLLPAIKDNIEKRHGGDVRVIRRNKMLQQLATDVKRVASELDSDNWIRDNNAGPFVMKPITVNRYGRRFLWAHGQRFLAMSATIISSEELSNSLGLGEEDRFVEEVEGMSPDDGAIEEIKWEGVTVPMTFPVENRPIYMVPVVDMAAKNKETAWPTMAKAISNVLKRHRGERVLVHCVSYALAHYLAHEVSKRDDPLRPFLMYTEAGEREGILAKFRATDRAVLFAPSMDRGVDLKDDDCRVMIVAKIPYPYLGDVQVSRRMNQGRAGQLWYDTLTVRTLVQMTGRAVRHKDDRADTYVLDAAGLKVYREKRRLLPEWWKEAVTMDLKVAELMR